MHNLATIGFAALLAWLPAGAGASEPPRDPANYIFQDSFGDLPEELEGARAAGKKGIFVFFEQDECPFCHRMKQTILNRPEVQAWFRDHFVNLTLDIEGDTEITAFDGTTMTAKEFAFRVHRVRATPVLAFFDLEGRRVMRYTGAPRDAEEFMWLGEFVAAGHYQSTNFTRFKRSRRDRAGSANPTQ